MAEDFTIPGVFSQKKRDGTSYDPVGKLSGIGAILGILAGVYGLIFASSTNTLFHLGGTTLGDPIIFLILGAGLLIQSFGSRELRIKLGSSFPQIGLIAAIVAILYYPYLIVTAGWGLSLYESLVMYSAALTAFFVIFWQIYQTIFADATQSWIGLLATICNGFFFPILVLGIVFGNTIVSGAFLLLILGQFFVLLFWWSPLDSIREYARSPDRAKFAFGLTGVLTFGLGGIAVVSHIYVAEWGLMWIPFGSMNAVYALSFTAALLLWVMQGPRLGKKTLADANLTGDMTSGGLKYFAAFLAAVGIYGTIQWTTFLLAAMAWGIVITWSIAGVLFIIGAVYMGRTDIITGLPLVATAVMISIHPLSIAIFVVLPFSAIIVSQLFLMVEIKIRGFGYYSQPLLSMLTTIVFSLIFLVFMIGGFGSGPAGIWPTNKWFNVTLFAEFPSAAQAATIFILPMAALILRNVSVVGFSHGRESSNKDVISGLTVLFAFLIPIVAAAYKGVAHQALTAAAILLALYAISFVTLLSLNLGLAGHVEDAGHAFEGMFIRMTAIVGMILGGMIALIVFGTFSSFETTALEMAGVITLLVVLIVGLEILLSIGWLLAGVRLGMLKAGFKFTRVTDEVAPVATEFETPVQ
ncbi:MAG: hypothetical protein P1Q69_11945 [Candidatus Thorarchaeota archaeon]|nr:hypothetical protein [Candidatus Thorarchaeota archaeon]